jgi:hypothetical protein
MALLTWADLSWDEFIGGLEGYRDHFSGKSREDETYVGCLTLMESRPLRTRAEGRELVDFLNRWACRLSSVKTPGLIADWANDHMTRLEQFEPCYDHARPRLFEVCERFEPYVRVMTARAERSRPRGRRQLFPRSSSSRRPPPRWPPLCGADEGGEGQVDVCLLSARLSSDARAAALASRFPFCS